eukprot:gene4961-5607_t
MLNLLPWIFCFLREFGLLVTEQDNKNNVESSELLHSKEQYTVQENCNFANDFTEENSLDDILEDTTWKAVNGLSLIFIINGRFRLSPRSSVENIESPTGLDTSVGDICDAEDGIRSAVLTRQESDVVVSKDPSLAAADIKELLVAQQNVDNANNIKIIEEDIWLEASDKFCESALSDDIYAAGYNRFLKPRTSEDERTMRKDSWDALSVENGSGGRDKQLSVSSKEGDKTEQEQFISQITMQISNEQKDISNLQQDKHVTQKHHMPERESSSIKMKMQPHSMGNTVLINNDSHKAVYNEFDVIMNKRKHHTDTMHMISDTFGHFGQREEKIFGSPSKRSLVHWQKLRHAVMSKRYLSFPDHELASCNNASAIGYLLKKLLILHCNFWTRNIEESDDPKLRNFLLL